ncbi:FAD/FMN-containing dehydrogenase [Leifsonia sp. 563]|uniref:FAD-binding oxidoreductase n=1 Tax=Leifsonia sp. 563 TaxID=3156412 RepID=UPI00339956DB
MDRRTLLRTGFGAAIGAGLGLSPTTMAHSVPEAAAFGGDGPDLEELRRALSRPDYLLIPGQPRYEQLAPPFNRQFASVRPLAIVTPRSPADIAACVRWAVRNGVPITPRSGLGHNYAGFSTTGGLLLVLSLMTDVVWQDDAHASAPVVGYSTGAMTKKAGTLLVEAGVTNGMLHPLLERGNIVLPTGRCSSVGVAGLVLGGGIGFSDKMAGLTCDRLVETRLIGADGEWITCSEKENADLFWAVRGGAGDNFGIHFDFTLDYDKYHGTVAFYRFSWSIDTAVDAAVALQRACADAFRDPRLHMRIGLGTSGTSAQQVRANASVTAIGQFYGSARELRDLLASALRLGTPSEQAANAASIRDVTLAEASELLNEDVAPAPFTGASAVLTEPLPGERIAAVRDHLLTWPGSSNPDGVDIALFALGGAVNDVAAEATAYVHRDALFIAQFNVNWSERDPASSLRVHREWLDGLTALVPSTRAYQNFPDPYLRDPQQAYYGRNYARLRAVKSAYDPNGVFGYAQGIAPQ